VADAILAPNYHLFAKVKIKMENIDLLLDDRYRLLDRASGE